MTDTPRDRIIIGISSCLLGEKVRFDGNHKLDNYIKQDLGDIFDYRSVCPEVGIGMGVPRPTIHLVGTPEAPRAVGVKDDSLDVTDQIIRFAHKASRNLTDISGYIFKSKSPSCGMERVKLYDGRGGGSKQGVGLYAREIMQLNPLLPVEEEGRLNDAPLRDNFLERVFAYHRWQQLNRKRISAKALIDFHSRHKLIVMAHSPEDYRALGRLVADAGKQPIRELADTYIDQFMAAMKKRATVRKHINVLHHIMGYLKKQLSSADKQELLELIEGYRNEQVPRMVPVVLLKHHFRNHPNEYMDTQLYLNPSPEEWRVRGFY